MLREEFINAKRIVIKLGTNVLRNSDGEVAISRIYSFIEDMAKLVKQGKEVILVTSGAVGLGKKKLNLESTAEDGVKQACAAVGQSRLMSFYENGFGISLGRLREDTVFDYKFVGLSHNTVRGAAGGAVLIAELLKAKGYITAK